MFILLKWLLRNKFLKQARTFATLGSSCFEHFIVTMEASANSVIEEAEDRTHNRVRSVEDYLLLRKATSAIRSTFASWNLVSIYRTKSSSIPTLVSLTQDAVDLVVFVNVRAISPFLNAYSVYKTDARRTCRTRTSANSVVA